MRRHFAALTPGFALLAAVVLGASPASAQVCLDFEAQPLGTLYGSPAGHLPGDLAFTEAGVDVRVGTFFHPGGGSAFNYAEIDLPPVVFASGQSVRTNNINLGFDFTWLPFQPTRAVVNFLDLGGHENLAINGSPIYRGDIAFAPPAMGGANVSVVTGAVPGGKRGRVRIRALPGNGIDQVRIGGQEFWIDHVCAWP